MANKKKEEIKKKMAALELIDIPIVQNSKLQQQVNLSYKYHIQQQQSDQKKQLEIIEAGNAV